MRYMYIMIDIWSTKIKTCFRDNILSIDKRFYFHSIKIIAFEDCSSSYVDRLLYHLLFDEIIKYIINMSRIIGEQIVRVRQVFQSILIIYSRNSNNWYFRLSNNWRFVNRMIVRKWLLRLNLSIEYYDWIQVITLSLNNMVLYNSTKMKLMKLFALVNIFI